MSPWSSVPAALRETAATARPDQGFTFIDEDGDTFCSFADVARRAGAYAAALVGTGLRTGDRVALALPSNQEFVFAFLGAMHVGLVPVPMYPPVSLGRLGFYLDQARHILHGSEAAVLLTAPRIKAALGSLIQRPLRTILTVAELGVNGTEAPLVDRRPEDPAFIQFTSGSTARPRGVVLTHANLAANIACIASGLKLRSDDVGCTWLPLYHDMGLIGFVLAPIRTRTPVVMMPPLFFLKRPIEWLRRISRHRGTIGFSPTFGYGLCASRIRPHHYEDLDLSSWRVAGCGAESIQMSVLEEFHRKFEKVGFAFTAFMPSYGLAESTLAVTFAPVGTPPRVDLVQLTKVSADGIAEPAGHDDTSAIRVTSCGRAFPEHQVRVLDERGVPCAPRIVGEIVIAGPSVMKGYYNDRAATDAVLSDGELRTGDLGYLVDGELFVCGRIKDLVIANGRNYHPTDIEWIVSQVPGTRRGRVVAFSISAGREEGPERVIVCVETQRTSPDGRDQIAEEVTARVREELGLRVSEVVLLDRGRLPRTSSGKLQRGRARELYVRGELQKANGYECPFALAGRLVASQWSLARLRLRSLLFGRGAIAGRR